MGDWFVCTREAYADYSSAAITHVDPDKMKELPRGPRDTFNEKVLVDVRRVKFFVWPSFAFKVKLRNPPVLDHEQEWRARHQATTQFQRALKQLRSERAFERGLDKM